MQDAASSSQRPGLAGLHHVALSVRDLDVSEEWYGRVLGFQRYMEADRESHVIRLMREPGGTPLALIRHQGSDGAEFAEQRCGLDHLAFGVSSREELEAWQAWFEKHGVVNSGIYQASRGPMIVFRDCDNIQLEVYFTEK